MDSTIAPTPQNRSGAPPLRNFTSAQRTHIQSKLPEFIAYLTEANPGVRDYDKGTSNWMSSTAKMIMGHDLFEASALNGRSPDVVEKEIRTFFRNWKNNTYKKSLPNTAASTSPSTVSSPATQRALSDAIRGLVILEGDLSPKDLFFREKPQEYSRAYQEVKATVPKGTHACVISQKAKKRAWEDADQEHWAQRKRGMELDVASNQEVWPVYLREAIQQNLDRGIVGSALVGIMYAMRTETEGMQHRILYAGYDSTAQSEIAHKPQAHGDIIKQWVQHSEFHLPYLKSPSIYQFELDEESKRPLLPLLDLADPNLALGQISEVLTRYLAALWDHGYPAENTMPTLPWVALAQDPAGHYDVGVFAFSSLIGNPAPCRPADAPGLYEDIARYQVAGTPFRFFTKEEYLLRAKDAAQRIIEEAETGEEVDAEERGRQQSVEKPAQPAGIQSGEGLASDTASAVVDAISHTLPLGKSVDSEAAPPPPPPPADENPAAFPHQDKVPRSPPRSPDQPSKKGKKNSTSKRKTMGNTTNTTKGGTDVPMRESARSRKQVDFGLQLVAQGQRSPKGQRAAWEYDSTRDVENHGPTKRARLD
ncbi:hypothetical protein FA13DRAFT_1786379 [Coprinellus micaceus]|uniref:Uncharacterized protein n=1 Tax=Coprinellus micaceus TaxID=71717 RepID=A0A4Y7TSL8_COPMI|nr:hypothetical protein FA13DRAFT_1786379 [Coprinellus micaceus]